MSGATMQIQCYRGASSRAFACGSGSTLWRGTYQKVTPFALVDVVHTDLELKSTKGIKKTVVPRNGDLLANAYVHIKTGPTGANKGYIKNVGMAALKHVKLYIGTQLIDEYTNIEASIHEELMGTVGKELTELTLNIPAESVRHKGFGEGNYSTGHGTVTFANSASPATIAGITAKIHFNNLEHGGEQLVSRSNNKSDPKSNKINLYVPLMFWFCQNPSSALPLVSLMYHDISIDMEFRRGTSTDDDEFLSIDYGKSGTTDHAIRSGTLADGLMLCDMVYTFVLLSSEEREALSQAKFEQLIVQHQRVAKSTQTLATTDKQMHPIELTFNHPVTSLFWCGWTKPNSGTSAAYPGVVNPFDFRGYATADGYWRDPFCQCQLKLNNQERFSKEHVPQYFRLVQPYQHFNRVPQENYIYCYSFAQAPTNWCQPSGHLNMSMVENATLNLRANAAQASDQIDIHVFALNMNVLRFSGGLGGARFVV